MIPYENTHWIHRIVAKNHRLRICCVFFPVCVFVFPQLNEARWVQLKNRRPSTKQMYSTHVYIAQYRRSGIQSERMLRFSLGVFKIVGFLFFFLINYVVSVSLMTMLPKTTKVLPICFEFNLKLFAIRYTVLFFLFIAIMQSFWRFKIQGRVISKSRKIFHGWFLSKSLFYLV